MIRVRRSSGNLRSKSLKVFECFKEVGVALLASGFHDKNIVSTYTWVFSRQRQD